MAEENIMYETLLKICGEKVCGINVFRTNLEIPAKYPMHPQYIP